MYRYLNIDLKPEMYEQVEMLAMSEQFEIEDYVIWLLKREVDRRRELVARMTEEFENEAYL